MSPAVNHSSLVGRCRRVRRISETLPIMRRVHCIVSTSHARSQTMQVKWMRRCRCFGFRYSLSPFRVSRHCNTRMGLPMLQSCYIVVSYLLLDVTVFCRPMNASEVTRQLLRCLAFNLQNFGLSEVELKLVVGLNFTVTRRS